MILTWREKLQLTKSRNTDTNQTTTATNYYVNLEDGDLYNVKLHKQQQAKRCKELLTETRKARVQCAGWLYNTRRRL